MGSCLGKDGGSTQGGTRPRSLGMQVDLAMTDPDLGWRRRNRHIVNPNTYPSVWRIEGLRPRYGEAVLTGMIELSIAAAVRALEIFNRYETLAAMDDGVDLSLIQHADNDPDIHKHFGLTKLEWKLLERCRPFRCAEVNPNGIQGAATLAKIKKVDNRMHNQEPAKILKAEGLPITQGSSWKEGDRVQIMVHKIEKSGSEEGIIPNETRYFFIDSAEVALNIIEFERQISRSSATYDDFIGQAISGWVHNQSNAMQDPRVRKLIKKRQATGMFMKYVYAISPKGEVFEFVPEELLLSITSRLQEAFMTQSAF